MIKSFVLLPPCLVFITILTPSVCRRASDNREAFSTARDIVLIFMREAQCWVCKFVHLHSPASAKNALSTLHSHSSSLFLNNRAESILKFC